MRREHVGSRQKSDSQQPLFSVIVPVFNQANFLRASIGSILGQSFDSFEIIVVDDGSTDHSSKLARTLLDGRGHVLCQENRGVSAARNAGIVTARGELISFLDADDQWDPDYLAAISRLSTRFPQAGLFATGYRKWFPRGDLVEVTLECPGSSPQQLIPDYFKRVCAEHFVWTGCTTVPRSILEQVGGFAEGVAFGEDLDLWARIAKSHPIAYDSTTLANYRVATVLIAPRYRKPVDSLRIVDTLRSLLEEGGSAVWRTDVENYIDHLIWDAAYMVSRHGTRHDLARLLRATHGDRTYPLLHALSRVPGATALLRGGLRLHSARKSRLGMRLVGGACVRNGVITRLVRRPKSLLSSELNGMGHNGEPMEEQ